MSCRLVSTGLRRGRIVCHIWEDFDDLASGMEAGTVETEGLDVEHDSPVPERQTHDLSRPTLLMGE